MPNEINTDHFYASRLQRRDMITEELETWLDEVEADEHDALEDDDCGDY